MTYPPRFVLGIFVIVLLAACGTPGPTGLQQPEATVAPQGSTISYDDGVKRIYSFVVSRGRLKVNYWTGWSWRWADQGLPKNTTGMTNFDLQGLPSVVSYKDSAHRQHIRVFVRGRDRHLYMNYWNGSAWSWHHLGTPGSLTNLAYNTPEAITYKDPQGRQHHYVFVKGSNNRLYAASMVEGVSGWAWQDHGLPPGSSGIYPTIQATTYFDRQIRKQRTYVFAVANQKLFVRYFNGSSWAWANQGKPSANVSGMVGVASYRYVLKDRIYALVRGSNSHVYVNYWDGSSWQWQDAGIPPGTTISSWPKPDTIHYLAGGWARMETFIRGNNGHLYILHYDDARANEWYWENQNMPPGTTVSTLHGATTYTDPQQRAYAFVKGANGGYYVNYTLNTAVGGQRPWAFQGTP